MSRTRKYSVDRVSPELVEWVKARCEVEQDGCWIWKLSAHDGTQPQGKFQGKVINVRRLLVAQLMGRQVRHSWIATCKCGTHLCANPLHLHEQSRSLAFRGVEFSVVHRANLAKSARARATLTQEAVEIIRTTDQPKPELARLFGVTADHIGQVLANKVWKEYASPFAGLGARI